MTKSILKDYLGLEILKINQTMIDKTRKELLSAIPSWFELIDNSFLKQDLKDDYKELLENRIKLLDL